MKSTTLPETNMSSPANGWLEDDSFHVLRDGPFSGAMLVLGRVRFLTYLQGGLPTSFK